MRTQDQLDRALDQAFLSIEILINEVHELQRANKGLLERVATLEKHKTSVNSTFTVLDKYALMNNQLHEATEAEIGYFKVILDECVYKLERIERTRLELVK